MRLPRPARSIILGILLLFAAGLASTPALTAADANPGSDSSAAIESRAADKDRRSAQPDRWSLRPHITARSVPPSNLASGTASPYGLTRKDVDAITQMLPNLQFVVPVREIRRQARVGDRTTDVKLIGTTPEYLSLHSAAVEQGRFLVAEDGEQRRNVAAIGSQVARQLFLHEDPIGKHIRIGQGAYTVVGILKPDRDDGRADAIDESDRCIYLPIATMWGRIGDRETVRRGGNIQIEHFELTRIEILVRNLDEVPRTTDIVQHVLDRLHDDQTYEVTSALEELEEK